MRLLSLHYKVKTVSPEKMLSSLIRTGIPFSVPKREEDGFSFDSGIFMHRAVTRWAREERCEISSEFQGLIQPVFALKRRPGIIFGTILSLFLIYLSTFYVWSVRIEGNRNLSDREIIQLLQQCGFGEGTRKSSVDVNEIQNTALARCHELSFLSVNIHGMVADVVVHERQTSPRAVDTTTPYNLVADADGVIVSSVILDGQSLFETGDTVFKGQLLVSGLVDSTSGITNIRHARGKVYARTNRVLTFEIPYKQIERKYTHSEEYRGIRVLGHSFYRKPKDTSGNWDVETEEREVKLAGLRLPLTFELRRVNYFSEDTVSLTPEQAEEMALEEYRSYLSTELDSAQILEEVFSTEESMDGIILTAEVTAIENIATEKKFEIME